VGQEPSLSRKCVTCGLLYPESSAACPADGTLLVPLSDGNLIGSIFASRYEILSILGEGGMGVVYLAKHQLMDRLVAIKMLHGHLVSDHTSLKRFQQEARTASLLAHPKIVTVHDFGVTDDGRPYLILDYLKGRGLRELIDEEGPLSAERAVKIFSQVCDGLSHAHSKGVIHRDLKPSNIMLIDGEDDGVKLLDFGIAKLLPQSGLQSQSLTASGEVFGTPLYMAPEQILGFPTDARSDLYSVGCVMYEVLCGKPPFAGHSLFETMQKHISEPIHPFSRYKSDLAVPAKLQSIIFKAMSKEPNDRQQTMLDLKQELDSVFDPPASDAVPRANVPPPRSRFKQTVITATVVALLVVTAGGTWWTSKQVSAKRQQRWERLYESAQIAFEKGNLAESEIVSRQALSVAQTFGNSDIRLAMTLDRLGQIDIRQKKYSEAKEYLQHAIDIKKRVLGSDDPQVAEGIVHLAIAYRLENNIAKSTELLDQAQAIEKSVFGQDSPEVAVVLVEKALLHEHAGKFAEAEAQYEQVLPILQKSMQVDDPEFAHVVKSYAKLLRRQHKELPAKQLEARYM
jgi:serine/threonine protein kinase